MSALHMKRLCCVRGGHQCMGVHAVASQNGFGVQLFKHALYCSMQRPSALEAGPSNKCGTK